MNAEELIAAIRVEHQEDPEPRTWDGDTWRYCYCCDVSWPCPASIAADRIEAALRYYGDPVACVMEMRAALDGSS